MEKTIYVLIAVFLTAMMFGVYSANREYGMESILYDGLDARVEKVLGLTPSEDMRHLLQQPQADPYFPEEGVFVENRYVVYLEGTQDIERLMGLFYDDLEYYCEVLYQSEEEWLYVDEAEEGVKADHWMILFSLNYPDEETTRPLVKEDVEKINAAVESYAKRLQLKAKYTESVDEVVKKAAHYDDLNKTYGKTVQLVLKADESAPFQGRTIHDAALALGMNLSYFGYVWEVEEQGRPWPMHFEVTDPESDMEPETLASNSYAAKSLVFSFYLPYSVAPAEVYDNMLVAMGYFQKRLGGTIQDEEGRVTTPEALETMKQQMLELAKKMEELGYKPGTDRAYLVF